MLIVTEIVSMKIVEGIGKEEFISIVDDLENNFHSRLPGFMDTELLYDEGKEEWIMIQHWSSAEQQKSASRKMFQADEAAVFVKSVIPNTVKMKTMYQIKKWK